MDCAAITERLPWLLNGRLDAGEGDEVRRHVAGCPRCREELEETRRAAAVFSAHLPTAVLVDLAWDRPRAGLDAELVRRHLDGCAECAEELDLARQSRGLEGTPDAIAAPPRRRAPGFAAWGALPATLAAGLAVGLWWGSARGPVRPPPEDARVAALEAEVARLRQAESALRTDRERTTQPQLNLPVVELFPAGLTRGPAGGAPNEVVLPPAASQVALVLTGETTPDGTAAIEIRDGRKKTIWSADGLRSGPLGAYTLAVPRLLLPEGEYVLIVRPSHGPPNTYSLRVRNQP